MAVSPRREATLCSALRLQTSALRPSDPERLPRPRGWEVSVRERGWAQRGRAPSLRPCGKARLQETLTPPGCWGSGGARARGSGMPWHPGRWGRKARPGTLLTSASKEAGGGRGLGFPPSLEGPFSASWNSSTKRCPHATLCPNLVSHSWGQQGLEGSPGKIEETWNPAQGRKERQTDGFPLLFLATTSKGSREREFDSHVTSPADSSGLVWPLAKHVFPKLNGESYFDKIHLP